MVGILPPVGRQNDGVAHVSESRRGAPGMGTRGGPDVAGILPPVGRQNVGNEGLAEI